MIEKIQRLYILGLEDHSAFLRSPDDDTESPSLLLCISTDKFSVDLAPEINGNQLNMDTFCIGQSLVANSLFPPI